MSLHPRHWDPKPFFFNSLPDADTFEHLMEIVQAVASMMKLRDGSLSLMRNVRLFQRFNKKWARIETIRDAMAKAQNYAELKTLCNLLVDGVADFARQVAALPDRRHFDRLVMSALNVSRYTQDLSAFVLNSTPKG